MDLRVPPPAGPRSDTCTCWCLLCAECSSRCRGKAVGNGTKPALSELPPQRLPVVMGSTVPKSFLKVNSLERGTHGSHRCFTDEETEHREVKRLAKVTQVRRDRAGVLTQVVRPQSLSPWPLLAVTSHHFNTVLLYCTYCSVSPLNCAAAIFL